MFNVINNQSKNQIFFWDFGFISLENDFELC